MPQLNLVSTKRNTPTQLTIHLNTMAEDTDSAVVTVYVKNVAGDLLGSSSKVFEGIELDYIASAFEAVVEGYQWGDSPMSAHRALRHVWQAARKHRMAHQR